MAREVSVKSPRIPEHIARQHIAACNHCGHTATRPYCPKNGRGLVQCQSCGLVYVGEQPDPHELYALYGETYFQNDESGEVGYSDYLADEVNIRKTVNRRFEHIERYTSRIGRMLDVGCALGFFMDEAAKRGWQVEGLDVSQFATEYVQERFGYPTHNMSLVDADLLTGAYDLVTMFDVIEHVPDPKGYIETVSDLLRPGGVFELATPDVGSLPARLTGRRWIGYKLSEEHVYYFSVKTISQMLHEAGFEVVHVRHIGKYVTLRLFIDRLGFYLPWLSRVLEMLEQRFQLSERSLYVNPYDIMAITARKR